MRIIQQGAPKSIVIEVTFLKSRFLRFLFFCSVVFSVFFCVSPANACIPVGGTPPPCSVYWTADAVFVGVVSESTKVSREHGELFDKLLVRFAVVESYRGVENKEIEVTTITGTECDTKIERGEKWLVYARRDVKTGRLQMWARTSLFSQADEDLLYIRSLSAGHHESSITVRVFNYPYSPVPGVRIEVRGKGVKYEGLTDDEGTFKVPAVKDGKYLVRGVFEAGVAATAPAYEKLPKRVEENSRRTMIEYQEDIDPGHCAYVELFVFLPRQKPKRL